MKTRALLATFMASGLGLLLLSYRIRHVDANAAAHPIEHFFFNFDVNIFNVDVLLGDIAYWRSRPPELGIRGLLLWHLLIDGLIFMPTYCLGIAVGLHRARARRRHVILPLGVFALDSMETGATFWVLIIRELKPPSDVALVFIRCASLAKWAAIGLSVALTVGAAWTRKQA